MAAGILLSRCAGLIREVVIGAFLGTSPAADAFKAALRIPNLMQNLLGEGVLSASFIPVYARLRAEGRDEEAGHLAGAIAGLLVALTGAISLVGVVFAEPLTSLLVPGFTGRQARPDGPADPHHVPRHRLPGAVGVVPGGAEQPPEVLPVLRRSRCCGTWPRSWPWWAASSSSAATRPRPTSADLAVALAWGVLVGGILQFGVQIGPVRRLLGDDRA